MDFSEFRDIFLGEAREYLQSLNDSLLKLEAEPGNTEPVQEMFRSAHSLKGMSATMGYDNMTKLTHEMENLLALLREGTVNLDDRLADILFNSLDTLENLVTQIENPELPQISVDDLIEEINRQVYNSINSFLKTADCITGSDCSERTEPPGKKGKEAVQINSSAGSDSLSARRTVRVDTIKLDNLVGLVTELGSWRAKFYDLADKECEAKFHNAVAHLDRVTAEIENAVSNLRIVQLKQMFGRFPRIVRDLSRERGKSIRLEITGGEVELDRSLTNQIGGPLVHLLRNAIDHGIESKEDRIKAGKDPTGRIKLEAKCEDNSIAFTVSDDGAGLDAEKLVATAVKKKIITGEQAEIFSGKDAYNLIFANGFSTADEITKISGRGVGMDAVKTAVENINGAIEVNSEVGRGTSFTLRIPLD